MSKKTTPPYPIYIVLSLVAVLLFCTVVFVVMKKKSDQEVRDRYMQQLFEFQQKRDNTSSPE